MAFDQKTRNLLQRTVTACRRVFDREFTAQLQELYGIQPDGTLTLCESLDHLADEELEVAHLLRSRINHLEGGEPSEALARTQAKPENVARVIREQAFTVLNRLAALRLCEERGLLLECVRKGVNSEGFQLFITTAGNALGETHEAYRVYLQCLFDELAIDLGVLFDRFSPLALLFPRKDALEEVLRELNGSGKAAESEAISAEQFAEIWKSDEAIGWIYQYYNDEAERKHMREESSAPRNSRELAVRNQFFTPRYVVEFLIDNTLGRLWYEMTQGETALGDRCHYLVRRPTEIFLKAGETTPEISAGSEAQVAEHLSQDELFRQPVYIPHRSLKDPREIRLLDPACGSMHFGLYAFDLLTVMYEEAWGIAHGLDEAAKSAETFATFVTFAGTFREDKAKFLLEVPRLIIEHNIHGIDIDLRAAQIAGLSLWLRAQRAWHESGVKTADRPGIKRSNLVCAEPMPGEKKLLSEFVEQQFDIGERPTFAFLLEKVFDRMALAGEAGSLLRIEEEIRSAIAEANALARAQSTPKQAGLFVGQETPEPEQLGLQGLLDDDFWRRAEQRIYDALEAYAEQAENGGGFQRRLFANDAAQGFAFIDLCRKRYDVVVMNPPFGDSSMGAASYLDNRYPGCGRDIYAAFIARGLALLNDGSRVGAITSRSGFFLSSMESWRSEMFISLGRIAEVADLGYGVLDAKVETAAYCVVRNPHDASSNQVPFIKVLGEEPKDLLIRSAVAQFRQGIRQPYVFLSGPTSFERLPGKPFAYSTRKEVFEAYERFPAFESEDRTIRAGVQSSDDFRFLRCYWEVLHSQISDCSDAPDWRTPKFQEFCTAESKIKTWFPFAKGGEYSPFYSDVPLLIRWKNDGAELKAYALTTPGTKHWSRNIRSTDCYFRPGLTYLARTSIRLCATPLPAGSIISNEAGPGIFVPAKDLRLALGRFNSMALELLTTISQRRGMEGDDQTKVYSVGALKTLPWPPQSDFEIESFIDEALTCVRSLRATDELSNSFIRPRLDNQDTDLAEAARAIWKVEQSICHTFGMDPIQCAHETIGANSSAEAIETISKSLLIADSGFSTMALVATRVLYIVGCIFGRWDIRYATGERPEPKLPDPFAPLYVCSPGMLQGDDGLPLSPDAGRKLRAEGEYPLDIAWDGIIVDDPEHPLDLLRNVNAAIGALWGDHANAVEREACEVLGVPTLREWFRRPSGFFADHLSRYTKSARQAPIYLPLSAPNGRYILWLYYPRLTSDTLFKCLQQFVLPKLADVEKELNRVRTVLGANEGGSRERKQLEDLEDLRRGLLELRADLELWAPKWRPDLNDGVLITAAPLWRLFRLPRWQKRLKKCWQELENGDYDWAHLAYSLWPDRVREKCKIDRSIAIAHGLEDLCEVKESVQKAKKSKNSKTQDDLKESVEG